MEKTMSKKIATGAFAVLVAGSLSFPSMALALESGTVGENAIANGTAANGEGWSYDGADTIDLNNYVGEAIWTVGNTIIELQGDNEVTGSIRTSSGDLTIVGDASVPADDKPGLTMKEYGAIGASGEADGEGGNVTIEGATVTFEDDGYVYATNDITIDNSYVGVDNPDENYIYVDAYNGSVTIKDSVIEAGDGGIYSDDTMTIDNSDVTVLGDENDNLVWKVYSRTGIVLKNMANGEVKQYTDADGYTWYYIDTNDGTSVKLKAAGTPGYYTGTKGMPQTGDSSGVLFAGASAAALVALAGAGLALRRKSGKHEA